VTERKNSQLFLLGLATFFSSAAFLHAQGVPRDESVLQLCADYSVSGDLLKAAVTAHSFSISITRPTGKVVELTEGIPNFVHDSTPAPSIVPCQLAFSASSGRAALAISTASGIFLQLFDPANGKLTHSVGVPPRFPIQFPIHPIGFVSGSDELAVSQVHYLSTGEPEIATQFVSADGSITSVPHIATGPRASEVSSSSFDFHRGRVWFLCPGYSARIDRQPRCTLTSAPLREASTPPLEIPPPPDDRVVGSGQPNLGFPSSDVAILLAEKRFWLYNFADRSFRQLSLPETPHHIRWFEFPGQPKFTSDGRFAAVPVGMFHYPLFQEGQVRHGTKVLIVELATLRILTTIQPAGKQNMVDLALHNDGGNLTLVANWGKEWRTFNIPAVVH
jgi:hypothetical protein